MRTDSTKLSSASRWHAPCDGDLQRTPQGAACATGALDMDPMQLKDTAAWRFQVIAAFAIALVLTTGGVFYLPVTTWIKGYLLMGLYFTVSSAFALAKTLRDAHESSRLIAKISEAKAEKMLRDLASA
jgi:hypothetical protein